MNFFFKTPTLLIDKHKIADIKLLFVSCPEYLPHSLYTYKPTTMPYNAPLIKTRGLASPVDVLIVSNISRHFQ